VLNYAEAVQIDTCQADRHRVVAAIDQVSGQSLELKSRVVINAGGVFAGQVAGLERGSGPAGQPMRIAPSRGTHLVLPNRFLPGTNALMIPKTDDGRVLFVIPWMGYALLGTTDVATDRIDVDPQATSNEVDYLLDHAGRYLQHRPTRRDVMSVFSGLRPLIGKANASTTASLSREHDIQVSPSGTISIVGGKWTTFRKMGRDVLEIAIQRGLLDARPETELTLTAYLQASSAATIDSDSSKGDRLRLHPELPIATLDIRQAIEKEMAVNVHDILARRTRCLLLNVAASLQVAPTVAQMMASIAGHNTSWVQNQLQQFQSLAAHYQIR
jgi:glycerol-3-phosphate dehydrogenase